MSGRPMMGTKKRVPLRASVDPATLEQIEVIRGRRESVGQVIDRLVAAELLRDRPRDDYSGLDE
jgi:chromosome segregation and condensation protein ScpB